MAGRRRRKAGRWILLALTVYLLAAVIPYLPHKTVSEEYRQEFRTEAFYSDKTGAERVLAVGDNQDALLYRLQMIEEAEEEILLSTFDFNADESGIDVMAVLYAAAERGVRIRILVDGISGFLDVQGNAFFQALSQNPDVELKIYNPVRLYKPWKLQARLHDKYLVIDDRLYLLGGRNTTNLFLGDYSSSKNIDQELLVYVPEGSAGGQTDQPGSLIQVKNYFEHIWALEDCAEYAGRKETARTERSRRQLQERYRELQERYPEAFQKPDWEAITMETSKITLLSNPVKAENREPWMWYSLCRLMEQGKKITIYSPYIICGPEMYQDLTALCKTADAVEIITNDVTSGANPWGCTDYLNQKNRILATGVRVYEFLGAHSNHTKAVLIDGRITVIGSYNLDMRSTYLDTELMLVVDSEKLNRQYREMAEQDKTWCRSVAEGEEYVEGENYIPRQFSLMKKVIYTILRGIIIPVRRLL